MKCDWCVFSVLLFETFCLVNSNFVIKNKYPNLVSVVFTVNQPGFKMNYFNAGRCYKFSSCSSLKLDADDPSHLTDFIQTVCFRKYIIVILTYLMISYQNDAQSKRRLTKTVYVTGIASMCHYHLSTLVVSCCRSYLTEDGPI